MTPVSFADISYDQGLQLLALRKQALDAGQIRRMTPEALANTFMLRDTGDRFVEKVADDGLLAKLKSGIENLGQRASAGWGGLDAATKNVLKSTAIGGGLGAGAGLGKAMLSGEDSYGRNILRGGAAGAALGGGLGLALSPDAVDNTYDRVRKLYEQHAKPKEEASAPTPASSTEAASAPTRPTYAQIKDEFPGSSPAEQKQTVQELTDRANTNVPELQAGATAAGEAYGAKRLLQWANNSKTYSPAKLSKTLQTELGGLDLATPKTQAQLNRVAALLGSTPDASTTKLLANRFLDNDQTAERSRIVAEKLKQKGLFNPNKFKVTPWLQDSLTNSLENSRGWWSRLTGAVPKQVSENISRALPGAADDVLSLATTKTPLLRNKRMAAAIGTLGGVEGVLRYLGIDPMQTYNKGVADREQARQTLNYLGLGK